MTGFQALRIAGSIGLFCLRHAVAMALTIAIPCLLWTVAYLGLLLYATVTGGGPGGPLAYPVGLLFVLATATAACLFLLFPSTALAEWIGRRRSLPILTQIPISIGILAILSVLLTLILDQRFPQALPLAPGQKLNPSITATALFCAHLLPLGCYWWIAQSIPLLTALFSRLIALFRT
jgi:hypothetical protein